MPDYDPSRASDTTSEHPTKPEKGAKGGGLLNAIEWLGNKLPDPAILFLIGLFIVLGVSHFAAPSLPQGFEVRWSSDANAGGVDQYVGTVGLVETTTNDQGEPAETFSPASYRVVTTEDGTLAAHLVMDESNQTVTDDAGNPINMAERGWAVFQKRPVEVTDPDTGETALVLEPTGGVMFAQSLITSNGWYWLLASMEANFLGFAPLGVVLLGMLGIGPMEKVGLIGALLKSALARVPNQLLTPAMVFLGIMSSVGSDAGYVVLPPLAAAAYAACGRSPLAGIAAVFAGVSAGFNANLLITSLEPLISNLSQDGAQNVDPARMVAATSSYYFMAVSTFVLTAVGWMTTAVFVEKRLTKKSPLDGGPDPALHDTSGDGALLKPEEKKGLLWAGVVFALGFAITVALVFIPNSPLAGDDGPFPKWVAVIVPIMFVLTILPAMAYGVATGVITSTKDAAKTMIESMSAMAPIIVLAFFAGQFVAAFDESGLGRMLAFSGGEWLFERDLEPGLLIVAFILLTMVFNLFVGSMSAKYALFAPIFVPMFMLIGLRPEMTQVAYRIGDSTTNIITPLNAYLVIVLMYVQKYAPKAGIGTLIAMMLPYTFAFSIAWIIMILAWNASGLPLGPGDPVEVFSPEYLEALSPGAAP
ncbi:MAG: AbgT family transporter [Planctomycetota bacterium]